MCLLISNTSTSLPNFSRLYARYLSQFSTENWAKEEEEMVKIAQGNIISVCGIVE